MTPVIFVKNVKDRAEVMLQDTTEAIYNLVGETEIKVTGKALLDDYKRLLFENNSLTARVAELKGFIGQLIEAGDAMSNAHSSWVAEEAKWDALVKDWKDLCRKCETEFTLLTEKETKCTSTPDEN